MSEMRPLPVSAWQPGESANPGGRPKWLKEFRDLARHHVPEGLTKLMEFCRGKVTNDGIEEKVPLRLQFQAVQELLDRTLGKPVQSTNLAVGLDPIEPMSSGERLLSDLQMAKEVAFLLDHGLRIREQWAAQPIGEPHVE